MGQGRRRKKKKEMLCSLSGTFLIRSSAQIEGSVLNLLVLALFLRRTPFPWRWLNSSPDIPFFESTSPFLTHSFNYNSVCPVIHIRGFNIPFNLIFQLDGIQANFSESFLSTGTLLALEDTDVSTTLSLLFRLCYSSCENRIFKPYLLRNKRCIKSMRESGQLFSGA